MIRRVNANVSSVLFVLDEQHTIQWSYLSPVGINPGADGILDALEAMTQPVKS